MTKDKLLNTISSLSIDLFALAVSLNQLAGCKDKSVEVLAMSQTLREWAESGAKEDLH